MYVCILSAYVRSQSIHKIHLLQLTACNTCVLSFASNFKTCTCVGVSLDNVNITDVRYVCTYVCKKTLTLTSLHQRRTFIIQIRVIFLSLQHPLHVRTYVHAI